jgi:hypothetical protein
MRLRPRRVFSLENFSPFLTSWLGATLEDPRSESAAPGKPEKYAFNAAEIGPRQIRRPSP